MQSLRRFATAHPLPFVIGAPVVWMMIGGIAAYLTASVLRLPPAHQLPQALGTLAATACLLLVMWRWEWLRAAGVTVLGSRRLWLLTAGLAAFVVVAYQFAFFGEIVIDLSASWAAGEAPAILGRQVVVGVVEETLFRGFLLYALVRVWGDTRRGLLAAVTLPALLFGLPHIMQVFAGNPLDDTLMTILNSFVGGLWWGALVLLGGSIWPVVLIHAATNASFQIGAASLTGFDPSIASYALATLAELPLVVAGLWLLLRKVPDSIPTGRQKRVAKASTSASTIGPLFLLLFLLTSLLAGCQQSSAATREFQVQAPDVSLHVRVAGDPASENVLIAIHGGPGMTSDYMLNLEELAGPDLAVVTYDQRGVGRSSSPRAEPENYTLARYAEDLDAVREAVGAESIHLFGHSWGGIVAQRYATLHPERVRSIVLMGSGPPTREQTLRCQDAIRQRVIELMEQGIISEDPAPGSVEAERGYLPAYFSDPNFWFWEDDTNRAPLLDERVTQVNDLTWAANASYDLTSDLARLHHHVLNLWGDGDPAQPIASPAILAALPNAHVETVVFNHCGHFWHECPEQFSTAVLACLGLEEPKK